MDGTVAIVLKGYPRLSETFIAQEILGLERAGLRLRLYAMRRPTDRTVHPVHREISAPVAYLPEYLHQEPLRVLKAWWTARRRLGYRAARRIWLGDLRRDPSRNRLRRWGQALVLAAELAPDVRRLHAHFIHTPAAVTRYAGLLTGLPWSCSAHAKDIWTSPDWELAEKLAAAEWVVTCTRAGRSRLAALAREPRRVHLSYHGLDFDRFPAFTEPRSRRDGSAADDPVVLLTVGRAVEKKGLDTLLDALARLPGELHWRWLHVGSGELLPALKARAAGLGLDGRIEWRGAQPQQAVLALYRRADLFVLPCRVARDGDRDGLPNVLVEAQSQRLACISTSVSAVPELIGDGETGLLVPPEDPAALAAAIAGLIRDPELRERLGRAGEGRVRGQFSHSGGIAYLSGLFGAAPSATEPASAQT